MKHLIFVMGLFLATHATAQVQWISADIEAKQLGSGTPAKAVTIGDESAIIVRDGYYHVPQYMSQFPTATTLWPRVVEVLCDEDVQANTLKCDGYHWTPALGRGEYLMFVPKIRPKPEPLPQPTAPACCTAPIVKIIEIEVPRKKKNQ